jgi:hypothetical protein
MADRDIRRRRALRWIRETVLKQAIKNKSILGGNVPNLHDKIRSEAAAIVTDCNALDLFNQTAINNMFGYFFETIYWNENKFQYLEQMTFSTWHITEYLGQNTLTTVKSPIIITYRSFDRYCCIQTIQTAQNARFLEIFGDGTDDLADINAKTVGLLPIASEVMCWFFRVTFADGTSTSGPLITNSQEGCPAWVERREGKEHIRINARQIYEFFAAMYPRNPHPQR